jgi:hypothetical protein
MGEFENEIRDLREKTELNLRQFLRTDLQTIFIALEKGRLELSFGNTVEAEWEFEMATRGTQVVERLSSKAGGEKAEIEQKLAELREALASFRSDLDAYPD